jgi:hypothetical protein
VSVVPSARWAVTCTLTGVPEVAVEAEGATTNRTAAAACTVTGPDWPVTDGRAVSVAVTRWVPAVAKATPAVKVCRPASPAVKV